jgi:hypothetical protein
LRTSNDAAVSIVPPKIPYGGFSPVRLQGWRIRRDLPRTSIGLSLLPAYPDLRSVCRRPSCFSVDPPKVGSVDAMYCTAMRWNAPPTPGALAPVGFMLSRPSSLNRPHPPHSRAHRNFTALRLICDASAVRERLGHPRAVPVFRCRFLPGMPPPTTPGSSTMVSSRAATSMVPSARSQRLGTPTTPAIRFTRGINFGASTVHTFAAACQVARPPERI